MENKTFMVQMEKGNNIEVPILYENTGLVVHRSIKDDAPKSSEYTVSHKASGLSIFPRLRHKKIAIDIADAFVDLVSRMGVSELWLQPNPKSKYKQEMLNIRDIIQPLRYDYLNCVTSVEKYRKAYKSGDVKDAGPKTMTTIELVIHTLYESEPGIFDIVNTMEDRMKSAYMENTNV